MFCEYSVCICAAGYVVINVLYLTGHKNVAKICLLLAHQFYMLLKMPSMPSEQYIVYRALDLCLPINAARSSVMPEDYYSTHVLTNC